MIVFLTSSPSGPLDQSRRVDGLDTWNGFVDQLKAYWKDNALCLMIAAEPYDLEENDRMVSFFAGAIEKAGLSYRRFDIWDNRKKSMTQKQLHNYDVIFLAGGHVPTQNKFMTSNGLRRKMEGYKGIVIGISAGTMNSADIVYAQPELTGEAVDPNYKRFIKGLNLTKTQILPHYQMMKKEWIDGMRLYDDVTYGDSIGHRFLALPDGSYLLGIDGQETIYGEAYEIADGTIRQICRKGEKLPWV